MPDVLVLYLLLLQLLVFSSSGISFHQERIVVHRIDDDKKNILAKQTRPIELRSQYSEKQTCNKNRRETLDRLLMPSERETDRPKEDTFEQVVKRT
jgi:hypothetical protein